jgi:hypothetical protein
MQFFKLLLLLVLSSLPAILTIHPNMNASAILEEIQPLADLAHEVMQAHHALRLSLQYNHYHHSTKDKLDCYIKGDELISALHFSGIRLTPTTALENLSSKAPNFPEVFLPPPYLEHIPKLRLEADQRLADISEVKTRVEQFIENPPKQSIDVNQRNIYALLNERPAPTINLLHSICRKSSDRAYNGVYYPYSFMVDPLYLDAQEPDVPRLEWTRDLNGPTPLRMCVQLKSDVPEDEVERFGKMLPVGAVREEYTKALPEDLHRVYWVVGLTGDEREVLLLHPLVRGIQPFQPKFNISLAFD